MADPLSVYLVFEEENVERPLRLLSNRLIGLESTEMHAAARRLYVVTQEGASDTRKRLFNLLLHATIALNGLETLRDPLILRSMAESAFWIDRNVRQGTRAWAHTEEVKAWLTEQDNTYGDWNFRHVHWLFVTQAAEIAQVVFHAHRPRRVWHEGRKA